MTITALTPEQVKNNIKQDMFVGPGIDPLTDLPFEMTKGQRGLIVGTLNRLMGGDMFRRMALSWLFDRTDEQVSSKTLTNDQWYALWEWCELYKDSETGEWCFSPTLPVECALVVTQAVRKARGDDQPIVMDTVRSLGGQITSITDEGEKPTFVQGVVAPNLSPKMRERKSILVTGDESPF